MRGRPFTLKCPRCRATRIERSPQPTREAWRSMVLRTLYHVACATCGHRWWTTHGRGKA